MAHIVASTNKSPYTHNGQQWPVCRPGETIVFCRTAEYAMRAMAWLAMTPDSPVSGLSIAKKARIPSAYMTKVMQSLCMAGLVLGRRGKKGGYKLARPADQVTLLEIIEKFAEVRRISTCPLGLECHGTTLCPLHSRMDAAALAVINEFGGATLQDLISDPHATKPLCDLSAPTSLTISASIARR